MYWLATTNRGPFDIWYMLWQAYVYNVVQIGLWYGVPVNPKTALASRAA